jgi:hypothetical protein
MQPRPHASSAVLSVVAVLLAALAGCAGGGHQPGAGHADQAPVATTEADWKGVADALGRTGKLDSTGVYRVPLTRSDLAVVSRGVLIKPGLSLGGYATFTRYHDATLTMGDLVVTEAELPKVTDALQAHGIEQTALHKHLLEQSPPVWWTHFHAMGDPVRLAQGVRAALDVTATPPATATPAPQPPVDLDTAGIDNALGRTGTVDGGLDKFTVARRETITDDGHVLPPGTGVTTVINFQPLGGGRAAVNGDLVMTAPEVNHVIQALRRGGIDVVELHNHGLSDQPRLFYLHFWSTGDGVTLARSLRLAVDATNVRPGGTG